MHRSKNGPSEKLDFSMPYCSILFTDSEYTTLFEMPSILSELEPIKVRKSTGQKRCNITSMSLIKMDLFHCKSHHSEAEPCKIKQTYFLIYIKAFMLYPRASGFRSHDQSFSFDHAISAYQVASSILYKLHFFYHSIKSTPATNLCQNDKTTKETSSKAYNAQTKAIV